LYLNKAVSETKQRPIGKGLESEFFMQGLAASLQLPGLVALFPWQQNPAPPLGQQTA